MIVAAHVLVPYLFFRVTVSVTVITVLGLMLAKHAGAALNAFPFWVMLHDVLPIIDAVSPAPIMEPVESDELPVHAPVIVADVLAVVGDDDPVQAAVANATAMLNADRTRMTSSLEDPIKRCASFETVTNRAPPKNWQSRSAARHSAKDTPYVLLSRPRPVWTSAPSRSVVLQKESPATDRMRTIDAVSA